MLQRLGVIAVLLVGVALLTAQEQKEGKDKKEGNGLKGTIIKLDLAKKTVKIKTSEGEKEYTLGKDTQLSTGGKQKHKPFDSNDRQSGAALQILGTSASPGTEVKVELADDGKTVKELCFTGQSAPTEPRRPGTQRERQQPKKKATEKKEEDKKEDK